MVVRCVAQFKYTLLREYSIKLIMICEISGSQGVEYEDDSLL
jgi:hypothetical protein